MKVSTDAWELPKQARTNDIEIILEDGRTLNITDKEIRAYPAGEFDDAIVTDINELFKNKE